MTTHRETALRDERAGKLREKGYFRDRNVLPKRFWHFTHPNRMGYYVLLGPGGAVRLGPSYIQSHPASAAFMRDVFGEVSKP